MEKPKLSKLQESIKAIKARLEVYKQLPQSEPLNKVMMEEQASLQSLEESNELEEAEQAARVKARLKRGYLPDYNPVTDK